MMRAGSEEGFGLVGAVFILVVLALVGAVMLSVSGVQRRTSSLALLGARAYHAGSSGIEWGMYQALSGGACPPATTLNLAEGGVAGFSVDVSCTSSQHQENGTNLTVYEIVAVAQNGSLGDFDYVRRRLRGTATNAP